MLGAIVGDMVGSPYEGTDFKSRNFDLFIRASRFTDDTVLTVAVAHCLLEGGDFAAYLRDYARRYPRAGYGPMFIDWFRRDDAGAYGSFGNGSAMRVAPVAYADPDLDTVLSLAAASAMPTHDHPEGVKGAQAVAAAIHLARDGYSRADIRAFTRERFGYDMRRTVEDIRPTYRMDATCQGSVPEALICVLEAEGFEEAVRNAVYIGGDSDTIACIAGAVGEALWGIPDWITREARARLDPPLAAVVDRFQDRFCATPRPAAGPGTDAPEFPPPWVMAPDWPADSIGWRMGGEQAYFAFCDMFSGLGPKEQVAYLRAYPARADWDGIYGTLKGRAPPRG